MYNRAFLRTYCEYLGMDSKAALEHLEAEISPPVEKPAKAKVSLPQAASSSRSRPLLAWSAMLLISVVGIFFSRHWLTAVFSPYFSRPSVSLNTPPSPPPSSVQASAQTEDAAPTVTLEASSDAPPAALAQLSESPVTAQAEETLAPPAAPLRIELQVLQMCWLSITKDGGQANSMLLQPGNDQSFGASERFYLILGNAGGVRMKINGMLTKPLGKAGEVVKILINEQNFRDLLQETAG
jgi:cytoskeletal protein RodZ